MKNKNSSIQSILLSMYEKLVTGHELKTIAQMAYEHLGNPLIASDKSCRLLCSIGLPEDDENPVWRSLRDEGYYPLEYLEAITYNPKYSRIYTETSPVLLEDDFSGHRCLTFKLAFGSAVIGFAQLVELHRPITARDAELFAAFCRIAGTALCGKKPEEEALKKSYEYVIDEILKGNLRGDKMKDQLLAVNIEPKQPRCLFVVERGDGGKLQTEYVRRSIEAILRDSQCSVHSNKIVLLLKSRGTALLPPDVRARFKEFLTENNLICGGSNRFLSMNDLPSAYHQAVTASRVGHQMAGKGPIFFMWEYATYQMCDMLYDQCELLDFCNPMIIMIRQYDERSNTKFSETLREYIQSGCSPVKTAENLGVHRNTIDYRLGRMKELFGLNTDDPEMMFSFKQSFQIIYYIEKNRREGKPYTESQL